jgi:hypothetical protein
MRDAALTDRQKTEKGLYGSYAPRVRGREVIAQWKGVSWTRQKEGAVMNSKIAFRSAMLVLVAALLGVVGAAVPPASAEPPKTGPTGKTEKQCNADHKACLTNCDKTIIDIGNQIQQCKDRCNDTVVLCQPLARTQQGNVGQLSGGQFQVTPSNPAPKTSPYQKQGMNAPIMRRGVEGEPATSAQTGQEDNAPAPK